MAQHRVGDSANVYSPGRLRAGYFALAGLLICGFALAHETRSVLPVLPDSLERP